MPRPSVALAVLASTALALAGCSTARKAALDPQTPHPATAAPAVAQPRPAVEAPATGAVREAMLSLRRVHFAFDSDALRPEAKRALAEAAERLASHPEVHLYVDGHADARGSADYNLALGARRAQVVRDELVRLGIGGDRLHTASFGKDHPLAAGAGTAVWAQNRRTEFRLMRGELRFTLDPGVVFDDAGRPFGAERLSSATPAAVGTKLARR